MKSLKIIIVVISSCWWSTLAEAAEERTGEQLYTDFGCILCHGISGHRGATAGRPLAPTNHTLTSFSQLVRYPARSMPAYAPEAFSDEQMSRVFDYILSIPASPEVEDIDSLQELRDRLYEAE